MHDDSTAPCSVRIGMGKTQILECSKYKRSVCEKLEQFEGVIVL